MVLSVNLHVNELCEVVAIDRTTTAVPSNHKAIELLVDDNDVIVAHVVKDIPSTGLYGMETRLSIKKDGGYTYYKFTSESDDYQAVYNSYKENANNISNYCEKIIFSFCKLQNCLVYLQRQILNNPYSCLECGVDASTRYKRDFLLSALYTLNYLVKIKRYDEAQRIINNLDSCGGLCSQSKLTNKEDCGCGTITY